MSTDTRSSQAQYVSRTALDTGREGRLLRPIRAPPSPSHAAQQGQPKRRSHTYQPRASQPEMRPRRERGQLDVAASPGNQGHLLSRRLARHISRHMGESVARPRSLGLAAAAHPQLPGHLARSDSLVAQRGDPTAAAVRASSGAARGVCCLSSGTPKSRASRAVLPFPCTAAHAHQRGSRIRALLAPTAARRHSSGRQPMHLAGGRVQEQRSKHSMDLIAVQAPLPPSEDALLRDCSVTVIVAGAGLSVL